MSDTKVPLTTAGITTLQTNLYSLSDPDLFDEADAVHQDFVGWIDDHIELTSQQLEWLSDIDQLFIDYLSAKTAIAFKNRLPFSLEVPSVAGNGKWFQDKEPIAPRWQGSGNITATGELSFELGYSS
ncbi:hypothetical protein [Pedobacter insulae]|uniref:Uncharacterized protein n=1 Tax=Pedobacter insulae TaxID=414048 RepID=A0A1I2ZIN1_9SPHI|nr:hypothetical protein [Pedobacter insulae]SFH37590.1 hypothetical protein SAMN04489864_11052 [Pedobacter insulae]